MTLTETLTAEPPPLSLDSDGVLRVGGTRIPLETVVSAYEQGNTAEEIARKYPSLRLADVHLVLGYCLNHPEEVGAYLREREVRTEAVLRRIDSRRGTPVLRDLLEAHLPKPDEG